MLAVTTVVSLIAVRRDPSLVDRSPEAAAEQEATEVRGEALEHLPPESGRRRSGPEPLSDR